MPIQKYMSKIQSHDILSLEAQQEAGTDDLIKHNLKLVVKIANEYKGMGVEIADLIQAGNIGLIQSTETFDPSKGLFTVHAGYCIRKKIRQCLNANCSPVHESHHHKNNISKIYRYIKKFEGQHHYTPTIEHISDHLKISRVQVRNALRYQCNGKMEINHQVLQGHHTQTLPSDELEHKDNLRHLNSLLQGLTEQEQYILKERFFHNKTLKSISNSVGLSKTQIKNIQDRVLQKLRLLM